ncbi:MAG: sugar phosphate isomerase/epimerase [bacterium]
MIKLGVNSVLFGGLDFPTTARLTRLCGYDGIELSAIAGMCEHLVLDRWQEQADMIRRVAADNGLALLSMEVASLDEARLEKAFAAGQAIGIPLINVGPGGRSNEAGAVEQSVATLTARAALAAKYGVTLCCKAHVGSAVFNTPTTLAMMQAIAHPNFGVDMDPSHIWRAGEDPAEALRQVVARVRHVHIRDCKGRGPSPGEARDQACGRGDIDLPRYFRTLVEAHYDGPVCLEVIGAAGYDLAQKMAVAAESYGYMNACLKALQAR